MNKYSLDKTDVHSMGMAHKTYAKNGLRQFVASAVYADAGQKHAVKSVSIPSAEAHTDMVMGDHKRTADHVGGLRG